MTGGAHRDAGGHLVGVGRAGGDQRTRRRTPTRPARRRAGVPGAAGRPRCGGAGDGGPAVGLTWVTFTVSSATSGPVAAVERVASRTQWRSGLLWESRIAGSGGRGRHDPSAAASRASVATRSQSPAASASAGVSQEPPTQPTFGSARYDGAVAAVIPPVGQNRAGRDRRRRSTSGTPRRRTPRPGRTSSRCSPASSTASTSETVAVPGQERQPGVLHRARAAPASCRGRRGTARPRRRACLAWPGVDDGAGADQDLGHLGGDRRGSRRARPACAGSARSTGRPPATSARATGTACVDVVERRRPARPGRRSSEGLRRAGQRGPPRCGAADDGKTLAPMSAGADGGAEARRTARGRCRPTRRRAGRGRWPRGGRTRRRRRAGRAGRRRRRR